MKKIGFIDFYLDEWHANNYPAWFRENIALNAREIELAYAWGESSKAGGLNTSEWCAKYGFEACSSIEEVVEKSDCILVLSPDNPEHHERLAKIPLMTGKPVYIDKTFSPDLASGSRMFELAKKHGTPMFSSSALRFAKELAGWPDGTVNRETLEFAAAMGPGTFEHYSVHQLEMLVSLMGPGARRVKSLSTGSGRLLVIDYGDGRRASLTQLQDAPFQLTLQLKDGAGVFVGDCSDIFPRLLHAILDFFETGVSPVPKEETLEIMALREAGMEALGCDDQWVQVKCR